MSRDGRKTNLLASTERAVFGATITLVDLATGETACTAYTGVTAIQACKLAAAECDRRGPSWRVRVVSTPETILSDVLGERGVVPEPGLHGPRRTKRPLRVHPGVGRPHDGHDTPRAPMDGRVTTFEQAWRDAYGTPEAWERERHGTAQEAQREVYGTPLHWRHRRESAEVERLKRERRP